MCGVRFGLLRVLVGCAVSKMGLRASVKLSTMGLIYLMAS